jgi:hypothetical protein
MSNLIKSDITPQAMAAMTDALKKALGGVINKDSLEKAWNQSGSATTGITAYDLEAPAKSLVPVITPLRNMIPRVGGGTGTQANWRAVTAVNTTKVGVGVPQGQRGRTQTVATANYTAPYVTIGIEDYATDEAELAAMGFDDVLALMTLNNLRALMIAEEALIIGGNGTGGVALGTAPTPSLSNPSTSTGTIATGTTWSVICVALTLVGYLNTDLTLLSTTAIPVSGSVTGADGLTYTYNAGTSQKSVAGTTTVSGSTNTIAATVTAVPGAFAYAWFFGPSGSETLAQVTTINSVLFTSSTTTGTQSPAAFTADFSEDQYVFNGLLTYINQSGSGAYLKTMATGTAGTGTQLTADTEGGIVEIDTALKSFWDNSRLSPDAIWVSSQEQETIGIAILEGGSSAAQRFVFTTDQGNVKGGVIVRSYLNKFTMSGNQEIPVHLHPNIPPGTILFTTSQLPYPLSNVTNVMQVKTRRDYHQIDWPRKTRRYEYGIYSDQVLQHYFPASLGMITNIAPTT